MATTTTQVRHNFFRAMAPYALAALDPRLPLVGPQLDDLFGSQLATHGCGGGAGGNRVEDRLFHLLKGLYEKELVLGCQCRVSRRGAVVCNVVFGRRSPYSADPVTPSTLFNAFSVTKAVVAVLVHRHVEAGLISYDDPIAKHWPAFGQHGKDRITVADALEHRAGLQAAGQDQAMTSPFAGCDWQRMLVAMEMSRPVREDDGTILQAYHALSFGWILGGLLEKVTGTAFADLVRQHISVPLGIEDEFVVGWAKDKPLPENLAVVTAAPADDGMAQTLNAQNQTNDESDVAANDGGAQPDEEDADRPERMSSTMAATVEAMQGMQGDAMGMLPTVFNHQRFRRAVIPAANGHFSARALCTFYEALADGVLLPNTDTQLLRQGRSTDGMTEPSAVSSGNRLGVIGSGFQAFDVGETGSAYGHGGIGGSLGVCDPQSGLAVAITVNRLNTDCAPTVAIVDLLARELGLGQIGGYLPSRS